MHSRAADRKKRDGSRSRRGTSLADYLQNEPCGSARRVPEMNRQSRGTSGIPGRAITVACLALALGCGEQSAPPETIDSVQLKLDFGGGVTLNSVDYSLTGPGNFHQIGMIPVDASDTISTTFNNLPAPPMGTATYDIQVKGTASDNLELCKGETMFTVAPMTNAVVQIMLMCQGRATVSADVNVCPTIDSLSVIPSEVYVGSSMQLTLSARDPDNGPSPLAAAWSATSGTLSNLSTMGATFTCTAAGAFKIGVSVTDGTPAMKCMDSASVNVVCTAPPGGP
jgi:hypothetical protein